MPQLKLSIFSGNCAAIDHTLAGLHMVGAHSAGAKREDAPTDNAITEQFTSYE